VWIYDEGSQKSLNSPNVVQRYQKAMVIMTSNLKDTKSILRGDMSGTISLLYITLKRVVMNFFNTNAMSFLHYMNR
jgi:hypothetical protein